MSRRQRTGSSHTTLRWGDTEMLAPTAFLPFVGGESSLVGGVGTKQLVAAHWRWPVAWVCQFVIVPQLGPAETATFFADLELTIGIGQGMITFRRRSTVAVGGGPGTYPPFVLDNFLLPAQDIQSRVVLSQSGGLTDQAHDNMQFGFFVAPQTEVHALAEMMDVMNGEGSSGSDFETMDGRQVSAGLGFQEAPLSYRR